MSLQMTLAILAGTPAWVWLLLAGLLAIGLLQTLPRDLTPRRIAAPALLLMALSLSGAASTFAPALRPLALGCWLVGAALAIVGGARLLAMPDARWSAERRRLHVPGSWLPLALFIALFVLKYGVGVDLAMHPADRADRHFALLIATTYGVFSGLFAARAGMLWSKVRAGHAQRAATA